MEVPKIPPRPSKRIERSVSPSRYARSPLNDPSFLHTGHSSREGQLSTELPPRPPSVTLPSIGQEGSEYASFEDLSKTLTNEKDGSPQQTKNIAGDLPLHAPKASVPSSTAKSRIQTVTRTDSSQAAAMGVGKLSIPGEDKSGDSGRSDSSAGNRTRPGSVYKDDEEHGIPEIGVQVPMYPNAGDVQAPTPSPFESGATATGVGFFNKPGGRHHGRTKSGREIFHGPPGSYGMHGHGKVNSTEFEKDWYAKHPDDLRREKQGEYGPHVQVNRKDYHWVGDDLSKLVHSSASQGIGFGTSREAVGTPDEHIGYMASEEFASRMASPRPASGRPASISSKSGVHADSPLRNAEDAADNGLSKQKTRESEADEDVIHIDPPAHPSSKIHGGGYDPPTEDLGPRGGNTEEQGGWVSERGYGIPILASDEITKNPGAEYRTPAVHPELERRRDGEYTANDPDAQPAYITKQRTHSRSSSRNNSVASPKHIQRFASPEVDRSGTPLESHKEYEPLFPEDDDHHKKPKNAAEKFKRPELARHHFPSQDVWEDTPSSLQLETTVDTPEVPEDVQTPVDVPASKVFEKAETEESRKEVSKEDQESFLPEHTKRLANKHLTKAEGVTRPGMQQRFPSHDIWEDAPDHGQLVTTVSTPQTEDTNEYADDLPAAEKPSLPEQSSIPSRPQKKETSPVDKKAPILPDRPKPQIPVRPARAISPEKVPTRESQASTEAPQPKAKPQVPARPGGSKIAALQAGFLKDLNSKLGLGPQAPKVKEPEPEQEEEPPKPLQDARKGRAKGPQRRKPQSSPSPASAATVGADAAVPQVKLQVSSISTIWSIGDDGDVDVPAAKMAAKIQEVLKPAKTETAAAAETKSTTQEIPEKTNIQEPIESESAEIEEPELAKTSTKESTKSAEPDILETPAAVDATGGVPLDAVTGPEVTLPGSFPEPTAAVGSELQKQESAPAVGTVEQEPVHAEKSVRQEPVQAERTVAAAEGEERDAGQDAKVAV